MTRAEGPEGRDGGRDGGIYSSDSAGQTPSLASIYQVGRAWQGIRGIGGIWGVY